MVFCAIKLCVPETSATDRIIIKVSFVPRIIRKMFRIPFVSISSIQTSYVSRSIIKSVSQMKSCENFHPAPNRGVTE